MATKRHCSVFAAIASLAAAGLITGCASAPPSIDTGAAEGATYDGLYPVKNARADEAWARPGIDLTQYSKIMVQGAGIEFRPGGESGRTMLARSRGGPYEVTERQKEMLRKILIQSFVEELKESEHFELTSTPGPDVLLIRGSLLDVVSYVPPETTGARTTVFLSKIGEATLVLELRDSITETILARSVDRRAAEPNTGSGLQESNRARNAAEIKRATRVWARRLREALDTYGAPAD